MFYTAEHLSRLTGRDMDTIINDARGRPRGFRISRPAGVPPQKGDITFTSDDAAQVLQEGPGSFVLLSDAVKRTRLSADKLRRAAGDAVIEGMRGGDALYFAEALEAAWSKVDTTGYTMAKREHATFVG